VKPCRVLFTIEIDTLEMASSDRHNIEFRYNDGSWCGDNLLDLVEEQIEKTKKEGGCTCNNVHARVMSMGEPLDEERGDR